MPTFSNLLQLDDEEEKSKNDIISLICDLLYNFDFEENETKENEIIENKKNFKYRYGHAVRYSGALGLG